MAAAGGMRAAAAVRTAGTGLAATAGADVTGMADLSGWSPRTESVVIFRGSVFGSVPLPALVGCGGVFVTLDTGGGLPFWFSGGNTTRGPDLALISSGVSSRGTIFSMPSPVAMRSGNLELPSVGAGTILVGPASARMIGGSPLRGDPT